MELEKKCEESLSLLGLRVINPVTSAVPFAFDVAFTSSYI
jgi:hypothetical protein